MMRLPGEVTAMLH